MQNRLLYTLLALIAVILVVKTSLFTVSEGQLAIKSIGGNIVDSNFEPGLHFRIPLVEEVSRFDKRIITQLYPAERFLTKEQEQLNVDFYVKWRISNLRRFYEATGGTEEVANARLGETIKDSIKSVVTQRTLPQVITAERAEFTSAMMKNSRKVIVDTKNGNSLMYLPLDKLIASPPQSISNPNDTMTVAPARVPEIQVSPPEDPSRARGVR